MLLPSDGEHIGDTGNASALLGNELRLTAIEKKLRSRKLSSAQLVLHLHDFDAVKGPSDRISHSHEEHAHTWGALH